MSYRMAERLKLWAVVLVCLNLVGIFFCLVWLLWLALRGWL